LIEVGMFFGKTDTCIKNENRIWTWKLIW